MSKTTDIIAETDRYIASNYAPLPIVATRAEGCWLWDVEGRRYLDCIGAYSAVNHGHSHPKIIKALVEQARRLSLTSRAIHNDQLAHFCRALCEFTRYEMCLPMNTGVEAVETAIKLARKWGYERKGIAEDHAEIVVCRNNFHGRTTTVVGFSSEPQYKSGFGPFAPGFRAVDFDDLTQLSDALTDNTAAFLVEPIQAEAGIIVPRDGYLSEAVRICRERGVLTIFDEIQTGLGRTGTRFAYEHDAEARPDILVIGKALGGGVYPVSAILSSAELMGVFRPGDHGSTFGGNPLAAAVGLVALEVLQNEDLANRAAELGTRLMQRLKGIDSEEVVDIRGRGLLIGIEVAEMAGPARDFSMRLAAEGVLSKDTHRQVLRLAPPLVISADEIEWLASRIEAVFAANSPG